MVDSGKKMEFMLWKSKNRFIFAMHIAFRSPMGQMAGADMIQERLSALILGRQEFRKFDI